MNATERIAEAWAIAHEEAAWSSAITAAFGGPDSDDDRFVSAFTSALAGPAPYTIRIPAGVVEAAARRREEARMCADQWLVDIDEANRRGTPIEALTLREQAHPGRRLMRAQARRLRASIGRSR